MSLSAEAIDALVASGATAEMLAAVVKAEMQAEASRREAKREGARERQARKRERDRDVHALSREVTHVTRDTPETKVSPTPPSKTQTPEFTPPIVPPTKGDEGRFALTPGERAKSRSKGELPPTAPEMAAFDAWWQAWQNRVARQAAVPAFVRVIRSGVPIDVLIPATERYFAHLKVSGYSAAHPATWLNGRRWEDEVDGGMAGELTKPDRWRLMIQFFTEGTPWPADHGPEPGKPGCRAPPEILAEFDFLASQRSAA